MKAKLTFFSFPVCVSTCCICWRAAKSHQFSNSEFFKHISLDNHSSTLGTCTCMCLQSPLEDRLTLIPDAHLSLTLPQAGSKAKGGTTGFLDVFLNGKIHVGHVQICILSSLNQLCDLSSHLSFCFLFPLSSLLWIVTNKPFF